MAGLGAALAAMFPAESRVQFAAIAELRWRLLVNSLRRKGGKGELVARVIAWPILLVVMFFPVVGAGAGSYFFVSGGRPELLVLLLWGVFVYGQIIGINIAARPPAFDLNALIRYPMRYVDYVLVRIWFGLLDFQTVSTTLCLLAMLIGIAIAKIELVPWAAVVLLAFALTNLFFSRMVYAWCERWLAQRKTRELLGGLIILISLCAQLIGPALRYFDEGQHAAQLGVMTRVVSGLNQVSEVLPPGLAAGSIVNAGKGRFVVALGLAASVAAFGVVFFLLYSRRLRAQYRGEELGETVVSPAAKIQKKRGLVRPARSRSGGRTWISPVIAACVGKEIRYFLRSGPMLYNLVTPLFMIVVFSARTSSSRRPEHGSPFGLGQWHGLDFTFAYGAAYTMLLVVGLLYNTFGADGAGVQFYFLAPVRMRSVIVAKNLVSAGIMVLEMVLVFGVVTLVKGVPAASITAAVVSWLVFAMLANLIPGNLRSLYAPKAYEAGKTRRQGASGVSGIISLGVVLGSCVVGVAVVMGCLYENALWIATPVFLVLAAVALAGYLMVLGRVDGILMKRREWIAEELCKAA